MNTFCLTLVFLPFSTSVCNFLSVCLFLVCQKLEVNTQTHILSINLSTNWDCLNRYEISLAICLFIVHINIFAHFVLNEEYSFDQINMAKWIWSKFGEQDQKIGKEDMTENLIKCNNAINNTFSRQWSVILLFGITRLRLSRDRIKNCICITLTLIEWFHLKISISIRMLLQGSCLHTCRANHAHESP